MSGRGERPAEDDDDVQGEEDAESATIGETVFDEVGEPLGRIRGYEAGGFFVSTREGIEAMSIEHVRSGHDFGEAHLVWRCRNCDVETERLVWWTED